jgi:hypothetical protein
MDKPDEPLGRVAFGALQNNAEQPAALRLKESE